jgi:hypothetical protein
MTDARYDIDIPLSNEQHAQVSGRAASPARSQQQARRRALSHARLCGCRNFRTQSLTGKAQTSQDPTTATTVAAWE